jgi:uncharacterized protein DUF3180
MIAIRVRWLVAIVVVCALVTWPLLRHSYSSLPPLPWTVVPTLALLAIAEVAVGRTLRARITGLDTTRKNGRAPYWPEFHPTAGPDSHPTAGPQLRPAASARRPRRLDPAAMVRTLALAKASAYAAAVVAGIAAGFLIYLVSSVARSQPHGDLIAALAIFVAAVLLMMAAVYLERSCRLPDDSVEGMRTA